MVAFSSLVLALSSASAAFASVIDYHHHHHYHPHAKKHQYWPYHWPSWHHRSYNHPYWHRPAYHPTNHPAYHPTNNPPPNHPANYPPPNHPANYPPPNHPANNPPPNNPPTNNPPTNNPPTKQPPANDPPTNNPPAKQPPTNHIVPNQVARSIPPGQGIHDGFFYSFYREKKGQATFNDGPGGHFDVQWVDSGDIVAGLGWKPATPRNVTYNATWNAEHLNAYISVYGWFTDPTTEFYIVESCGFYDPSSASDKKGTVYSDGSIYDILVTTRYNAPSITGDTTFHQYWSVRRDKRLGGTVTVQNHFDAWAKLGLKLGKQDYMILAVESMGGSGQALVDLQDP